MGNSCGSVRFGTFNISTSLMSRGVCAASVAAAARHAIAPHAARQTVTVRKRLVRLRPAHAGGSDAKRSLSIGPSGIQGRGPGRSVCVGPIMALPLAVSIDSFGLSAIFLSLAGTKAGMRRRIDEQRLLHDAALRYTRRPVVGCPPKTPPGTSWYHGEYSPL